MSSGAGDTTQLVPGYPIRTPWDHSSVDSSPRPIAASHVLHRLLVPRHPPFALDNLTTKMLARSLCNSQPTTNPQPPPRHHTPPTTPPKGQPPAGISHRSCLARQQPTPPTGTPTKGTPTTGHTGCSLRTSTGCSAPTTSRTPTAFPHPHVTAGLRTHHHRAVASHRLASVSAT